MYLLFSSPLSPNHRPNKSFVTKQDKAKAILNKILSLPKHVEDLEDNFNPATTMELSDDVIDNVSKTLDNIILAIGDVRRYTS